MSTHEQKAREIIRRFGQTTRAVEELATALRATEAAAWKAGAEAMREAAGRRLAGSGQPGYAEEIRCMSLPTRPSDE